jgi:hypothetical protein
VTAGCLAAAIGYTLAAGYTGAPAGCSGSGGVVSGVAGARGRQLYVRWKSQAGGAGAAAGGGGAAAGGIGAVVTIGGTGAAATTGPRRRIAKSSYSSSRTACVRRGCSTSACDRATAGRHVGTVPTSKKSRSLGEDPKV